MDLFELIETRASTKSYNGIKPAEKDIDTVIHAGIRAASGRNMQAPIVVAVTDKTIRDKLSAANAAVMGASGDPFYNAPAVLVVLAKKTANTYVYDGSLVLGNMMLAAHALNLGSCWVHRAKEVFELPEWKEWLKSIGIDDEVEGIGNLILGYPSESIPAPKETKSGRVFKV